MKKIIIRVSDELLDLIENPNRYNPSEHTHCLWCGMLKAFRMRPCEVCGYDGNSCDPVGGAITITYGGRDNAPAHRPRNGTKKPGRRIKRVAR